MAIVKMSKISIFGSMTQKSQILKLLMKRGFVQIDDSTFLTEEEDFKGVLSKDSDESNVISTEQKIYQVGQAISVISAKIHNKKALFAPKEYFTEMEQSQAKDIFIKSVEVNNFSKKISSLKSDENVLTNNKNVLIPWEDFDIPFEKWETKHTKVILGTLPITQSINAIQEKFDDENAEILIGTIATDKQFTYIYLFGHKRVFDQGMETLRAHGFSSVSFSETEGTIKDNIAKYDQKIQSVVKEIEETTEKIKGCADLLPKLENLYDYFSVERDESKAVGKLVKTKTTFCLTGWLPQKKRDRLVKELSATFDCFVETSEVEGDEDFPILLENNALVTPFESVTNMYSVPGPTDIDPNPIMAFFYIIFFGMMLSDAGYGIILAFACGFIIWKGKMKKGEGNLYKLIGICGISTTVWGVIFGSGFGDLLPIKPIISPLEDVMVLMGMSLLFGIVHIYVGLGIKAINLIRGGKPLDALFDIGLWYLFITGVCLLIIPIVAGDIGVYAEIGKYLAIIGALGLVLTQGRSFKGIFMKGFKGVSSLYGITGYFADILSYSRLMALCLSTGVIGQVINLLGEIAGPVPAIIIGIIGHTANLLINALGAYVHTSRLQYVEFFSKFYEGGGTPFTPFQYNTKYTSINDKEM